MPEKYQLRLEACKFMVEHELTLRDVDKIYGIPFSTLDQWIHKKLPDIDNELYLEIKKRFAKNLEMGMNWKK